MAHVKELINKFDASNSNSPENRQLSDLPKQNSSAISEESNSSKVSSLNITSKPKYNYEQVAQEIYTSERSFADALETLYECYQAMVRINNERKLDLEKRIVEVFSDFIPIYRMQTDKFLPIMEKSYSKEKFWVGRVFNENSFIIKLYKPFIMKQLENEKNLMELLKNPVISEAVDEVLKRRHKMLGCANWYNVIFQRITRYSLLLKEYIKNLPDDCSDKKLAIEALRVISDDASQLNERKKVEEEFATQVMRVVARIKTKFQNSQLELHPWERFIKEGPVEKISARSITRVQSRYLFLFSGRLLVCESSLTTYVIKAQMEVSTMEIEEINDHNKHPNSFRLRGKEKIFDLKFESEELENEWRDAIAGVIAAYREKQQRINLDSTQEGKDSLGIKVPLWVRDQHCSMCMLCCVEFTFNNRRHHCRACGKCVCGQCSNYRENLECENGKSVRVCKKCKERLSHGVDIPDDPKSKVTTPNATMESYINFADKTHQFKEKYAILSGEGFIELRAKHEDPKPWMTIPIVGYELKPVPDSELCFQLSHPSSMFEYYVRCRTKEDYDKWYKEVDELLQEFVG